MSESGRVVWITDGDGRRRRFEAESFEEACDYAWRETRGLDDLVTFEVVR